MHRAQEDIHQELKEEFLVIVADTIVDPWAVMVHSSNAAFADRAVMAQWRLDRVTLLAVFEHDTVEVAQCRVVQNDVFFCFR